MYDNSSDCNTAEIVISLIVLFWGAMVQQVPFFIPKAGLLCEEISCVGSNRQLSK